MKLKFLFSLIISLFLFGLVTAQNPEVDTKQSKGYLLGPGDEVTGKVFGESEFDFVANVNEEGMIEVFDQIVAAKCRTEKELRADLTALLGKWLVKPQINIRTISKSRPPATIYGEVRNPTPVVLMRRTTLAELIAFSGGITEDAGGMIQVFRTQPPMCPGVGEDSRWVTVSTDPTDTPNRIYSLSNVLLGREESNPTIYPGDVIVVQKALPVYITGEVVAPQGIYLKEGGLSLSEAIAKVGGIRREAKTKDIKIYRLKSNSKDREVISANYDLIRKGQEKDVILQPHDIIEVDKAKDSVLKLIATFALGAGKTVITSASSNAGYRILY